MALIKCSECGKKVSEKAKSCPYCGNPEIDSIFIEKTNKKKSKKELKISIPVGLCFNEKNLYGDFIVGEEGLEINYSKTGMGKKNLYDIKYSDIQDIILEISPFPIAVKDLYILINSEKYHFYVSKANLEKWKELVVYLKNNIIENIEETNNIIRDEVSNQSNIQTINQSEGNINGGIKKVGFFPFVIVGVVICIIIFMFSSCSNDFKPYTKIRESIERNYNNVTNIGCSKYSSGEYELYDCSFNAGGLQIRYEVCAFCEKDKNSCFLGTINYKCKNYR